MASSSNSLTSPTGTRVSTTTPVSLWKVPTTLKTLAASIAALSAPRRLRISHNTFWQAVHLGRAALGKGDRNVGRARAPSGKQGTLA
jgi:hypothetical protein